MVEQSYSIMATVKSFGNIDFRLQISIVHCHVAHKINKAIAVGRVASYI